MAFTTIPGSGASDATSFIGTAGADSVLIQNVSNPVFADGQEANDIIQFASFTQLVTNYTLKGLDGDDTIQSLGAVGLGGPSASACLFNGNKGNDVIRLSSVSQSSVYGGDGNDLLAVTGLLSNSLMNGNEGTDTVTVASAASSSIFGGIGNDLITLTGAIPGGGAFNSTVVRADDGNDTININVNVTALSSTTINGNAGNDVINIFGVSSMTDSTIFGGEGADSINGFAAKGALVISGDAGTDQIVGSNFADALSGGDGNDTIFGSLGADTMVGGSGGDRFTYSSQTQTGNVATGVIDQIIDFAGGPNGDRIQGLGAGGAGQFATGGAFGSYAAALAAVSGAVTGADYILTAIGSGTSWTAVLFTEINNFAIFNPEGAIQIGATGEFGSAAQALASITATDILA